jgi:hypothetical protein
MFVRRRGPLILRWIWKVDSWTPRANLMAARRQWSYIFGIRHLEVQLETGHRF